MGWTEDRDVVTLPGFSCYEIHRDGRVYRVKGRRQGEVRSHIGNRHGYLKIKLMNERKRYHFWTHRLICLAFHGPPPQGRTFVRHLDNNPANNHADNLCWGSKWKNEHDKRNFTGELEEPDDFEDEDLPF